MYTKNSYLCMHTINIAIMTHKKSHLNFGQYSTVHMYVCTMYVLCNLILSFITSTKISFKRFFVRIYVCNCEYCEHFITSFWLVKNPNNWIMYVVLVVGKHTYM